ncbi:hypothetical protein [Methanolapillus millepedarum]|uniref:Lipoprotein n=1 Tax=Methanolapillus millepedarum TaxID=3028296 RepID=A0AA96V2X6_9EURY|nr:hypothetical protein MsAc7_10790 [Methanosarcinaceae archaeon Ac7]
MKTKTVLIGLLVLLSVFAAGCLNSDDDDANSTENNVTESVKYNSSYKTARYMPPHIPMDQQLTYFSSWSFIDYAYPPRNVLENEADLIVYVTIKEIQPAVWSTYDGKRPYLEEERLISGDENGTTVYKAIRSDDYDIYTDVIFTVDEWAKGNSSDEIKVRFIGGQVEDVVRFDTGYPDPRSLEVGDRYLLYLMYYSDAYELRYPNGMETITVKNGIFSLF